LYRSAVDDRVIGFQVKGITAILKIFEAEGALTVTQGAERSVTAIVLAALKVGKEGKPTLEQLEALTQVLRKIPEDKDRIAIPVAA